MNEVSKGFMITLGVVGALVVGAFLMRFTRKV